MFGQDLMMFEKKVNFDKKNRIYLPAKTKVEVHEEVVLVNEEYDDESFLTIWGLYIFEKEYNILKKYMNDAKKAGDFDRAGKINHQIKYMREQIVKNIKTDVQKRITIAKNIQDEYKLGKEVILYSEFDHIYIFKDEEELQHYKIKIKENNKKRS